MPKSAKNRSPKSKAAQVAAAKPADRQNTHPDAKKKGDAGSKQARVIAMLQSPSRTTIAAVMKATGWQQHSVRGFLAGVVRKKLNLKLKSEKVDGNRMFRVDSGEGTKAHSRQYKRRAA